MRSPETLLGFPSRNHPHRPVLPARNAPPKCSTARPLADPFHPHPRRDPSDLLPSLPSRPIVDRGLPAAHNSRHRSWRLSTRPERRASDLADERDDVSRLITSRRPPRRDVKTRYRGRGASAPPSIQDTTCLLCPTRHPPDGVCTSLALQAPHAALRSVQPDGDPPASRLSPSSIKLRAHPASPPSLIFHRTAPERLTM